MKSFMIIIYSVLFAVLGLACDIQGGNIKSTDIAFAEYDDSYEIIFDGKKLFMNRPPLLVHSLLAAKRIILIEVFYE